MGKRSEMGVTTSIFSHKKEEDINVVFNFFTARLR